MNPISNSIPSILVIVRLVVAKIYKMNDDSTKAIRSM